MIYTNLVEYIFNVLTVVDFIGIWIYTIIIHESAHFVTYKYLMKKSPVVHIDGTLGINLGFDISDADRVSRLIINLNVIIKRRLLCLLMLKSLGYK